MTPGHSELYTRGALDAIVLTTDFSCCAIGRGRRKNPYLRPGSCSIAEEPPFSRGGHRQRCAVTAHNTQLSLKQHAPMHVHATDQGPNAAH
eukprot:11033914-Ditylum_brightwellii.AAC.1